MWDGFFFNASVGLQPILPCAPVAAHENLNVPFLGEVLRSFQAIVVDRGDPQSKKQVITDLIKRATRAKEYNRKVLIFPEGTTSNGSTVIGFKLGAFNPGVPVQPVAIRYPHKHFNSAWVFGPSQVMVIVRMCCQFINYMEVEYLPVYKPSPEEIQNPTLFANNVRQVIASALKVPVTAHSFDDLRLATAAWSLHVPLDQASLEMDKIASMFNVDFKTVEKHLVTFAALDTHNTGNVSYTQFLQGFNLEDSPQLQKLWNNIDTGGDGQLQFKEYFYGLALLNETGDPKDAIKLAFDTFGSTVKGDSFMSFLDTVSLLQFAVPDVAEGTIQVRI